MKEGFKSKLVVILGLFVVIMGLFSIFGAKAGPLLASSSSDDSGQAGDSTDTDFA